MKIKTKKGELTTQQIVMLIILIVSFAIILFFIFRLNLGEITDKEICHNSVVMKSQSKLPSGELDCKTSYVCISGGGNCEGINPSVTINLKLENPKEEVMDAIAQQMADCWWMFGEGKVDYVDSGVHYSCGICSVIKFDKKIQGEFSSGISYKDFYSYLEKAKKDSTQTYFSYLYSSQNSNLVKGEIKTQSGIDIDSSVISFDEKFSIFTGSLYKIGSKDEFIPPYFVKFDEIPTQSSFLSFPTNCKNFDLTKA